MNSLLKLNTTMSRIWLMLTCVVIPNNITQIASHSSFSTFNIISSSVAILGLGSVIVHKRHTARATALATRIDGSANSIQNHDNKLLFQKTRNMGVKAARNMTFFMGSFAIRGIAQSFASYMKSNKNILSIGFGFGIIDAVESFSIAGLIFVLNRSFLHAVVDSTSVKSSKEGHVDYNVYVGLLEAQKGFYNKIGSVIKSAAIFTALGALWQLYKKVNVQCHYSYFKWLLQIIGNCENKLEE